MRCPACRETVRNGATKCRHCGSAITGEVSARDTLGQAAWWVGSAIGLALLVKGCADLGKHVAAAPGVAAEQPAPYVDLAECQKLLAGFRRVGMIRKLRDSDVYVDPPLWGRLDLDAKNGVLGAVLCVEHMGRVDTGAAYAYNAYTGRQLAHYQPDAFGLTIDAD